MPKQGQNKTTNFSDMYLIKRLSVLGDSKTEILILKSSFYKNIYIKKYKHICAEPKKSE